MKYRIIRDKSRYGSEEGYRIERKRFFFFWTPVDGNDNPFHFEHFSHGNDYVWYGTINNAEDTIKDWQAERILKKWRQKQKGTVIKYIETQS
jgi:hypothetical protein